MEKVTYQRADNGAQVEDDPEPRNIFTLILLGRVRHHNGSLGAPQKTSADTQESTSEDEETVVLGVVVAEEGSGVNTVTDATKRKSWTKTKTVGDGTGEETNHGESAVQGSVGVGIGVLLNLTGSSETTKGIKHARAEEAHDGDHEQLHFGGSKPCLLAKEVETLIDPSLGTVEILAGSIVMFVVQYLLGLVRGVVVVSHCDESCLAR